MPLYEYICEDCGKHFDALRPIKDADKSIPCQSCQGKKTKRLISVFNAHSGGRIIKGSGSNSCAGCAGGSCSSCGN
jgi:putative FmdB family regulatory protein